MDDEPYTIEEVSEMLHRLIDATNTLSGAIACILRTLEREGIQIEQLSSVTLN